MAAVSYTHLVQDGTPVSAVNMNKIEEGIMQAHQVADSLSLIHI